MADEFMITLYRVTDPGDDITTLDKIQFNKTSNKNQEDGAVITRYRVIGGDGIGDNQAANQDLSNLQWLGKNERAYILEGYVKNRSFGGVGTNPTIAVMKIWDDGAKTIDDDFEEGRMGIQFNDFAPYNLVPVGTGSSRKGLILVSIDWDNDYAKRKKNNPIAKFTITLKESRGDGT